MPFIQDQEDLYGVIEIALALHTFVNVDMRCQGYYAVRIKVLPDARIKTVWPYVVALRTDESESALPPAQQSTCGNGWWWRSKVFRIQYTYDTVDISTSAPCFQVFMREPCNLGSATLQLEIELLAQTLKPKQLNDFCDVSKMKVVATQKMRLTNIAGGLLNYHPASWGVEFQGLCHVSIGACLTGYATRATLISQGQRLGRDLRRPRGGRRLQVPMLTSGLLSTGSDGSETWQSKPRSTFTTPSSPGHPSSFMPSPLDPKNTQPAPPCVSPSSNCMSHFSGPSKNGKSAAGQGSSPARSAPEVISTMHEVLMSVIAPNVQAAHHQATKQTPPPPAVGAGSGTASGPMDSGQALRVQQTYTALVLPLAQGTVRVRRALRCIPTSCFYPQTYDALHALLTDNPAPNKICLQASLRPSGTLTPAMSMKMALNSSLRPPLALSPATSLTARAAEHVGSTAAQPSAREGTQSNQMNASLGRSLRHVTHMPACSSGPVIPRLGSTSETWGHGGDMDDRAFTLATTTDVVWDVVAADVASWEKVPDLATFVASLPPGCGPVVAAQYIEEVLGRLTREATTEWTVLQWVVESSGGDLMRYLGVLWELQQPELAGIWTFPANVLIGQQGEGVRAAGAVAASAVGVRARLQQRLPSEAPSLHLASVWDNASHQPLIFLDDSQGPHISLSYESVMAMQQGTRQPGTAHEPTVDSGRAGSGRKGLPLEATHLVVFVHGFQGAPWDLTPVRAHLHMLYPYLECRHSISNEGKHQDSLETMGKRLAAEVLAWIKPHLQPGAALPLTQLTFVAHSMGTLVVRAALALPEMAVVLPFLWLFISIAGPHLGQLFGENALLRAGLLFLKAATTQGSCLHQLDMSDMKGKDLSTSWLYRLATRSSSNSSSNSSNSPAGRAWVGGSLQGFRRVVLVASEQDRYVPIHSARLATCAGAVKDPGSWAARALSDMLAASTQGFGESPTAPQLLRVDVSFSPRGGPHPVSHVSDVLGRSAHVELVRSDELSWLLVWGVVHKLGLITPSATASPSASWIK